MKLGRFEFRFGRGLRAAALPAVAKERGASGTVNLSGFLQSSEYLDDLRGARGLATIDRMLRSDASVQEALEHIFAPIRNAAWQVEPASDDPEHLTHAAFLERAYFSHASETWLSSLDQQLDYLAYGFAVFEVLEQVVEDELSYEDPDTGDPVAVPGAQFLTLDRFAPRLQPTIYQWQAENGKLVSIVQQAMKDGDWGQWEIPAESLLLLTNKKRGDDFTGRSILRSAYKPFLMKELVEKIEVVALERWGVQIPVAYPPESAKNDDAVFDRLEDILANLRGGEASYVVMPGPKQNGQNDGYLLELMGPSGSPPDFKSAKEYHRAEIKAAVLARFAELGHQVTGARATGDTQSIVWFAALHSVSRFIAESHAPIIKRLVDANFPGVKDYPSLVAHDIESRNLLEYAQSVSALAASGALAMDKSARAAVRSAIDFPDEDEPDTADPNNPLNQNVPPPDPNADPSQKVEPEQQAGDGQHKQQAMEHADVVALSDRLEALAEDVRGAYRRNERDELAASVLDLAKSIAERDVNVKVDVEPRYEAHEHTHEHTSEGLSAEETRAIIREVNAEQKLVASRTFEKDGKGRIVRVREFDADGNQIGSRRILRDAAGELKTIKDED